MRKKSWSWQGSELMRRDAEAGLTWRTRLKDKEDVELCRGPQGWEFHLAIPLMLFF